MRTASLILALLLCTPITALGSGISNFKDGSKEVTASLDLPGLTDVVNLVIPAECHISSAKVKVSSVIADSNMKFPEGVSVLLNNSPIWEFNGTGCGALGMQDSFVNGSKEWMTGFAAMPVIGNLANSTKIRLPKNAMVQNATFDVECSGWGLNPIKSYFGQQAEGFGVNVNDAGDVNGDGYDDVIIGAENPGGRGRAYICFGGEHMNDTPDVTLSEGILGDGFGARVCGAGDLNGDGFDDVMVAAVWNDTGGDYAGTVYIYWGGIAMNTAPDIIMDGSNAGDLLGLSLLCSGDVNADGYDDLLLGAIGNDSVGKGAGREYLYFGGRNMDNVPDVIFTGANGYSEIGNCSVFGDLNGDGYDDIILGAPGNDAGGKDNGSMFVFFGGSNIDTVPDLILNGEHWGDGLGSVASGDVNGDGYDDFVVGAPGYDPDGMQSVGRAYIYLGGKNMDAVPDMIIEGGSPLDYFGGIFPSSCNDLNNDGYDDIVIGTPSNNTYGYYSGVIYVYFGGANMDNMPDAIFIGENTGDFFGISAAACGDINGDGYGGIIVGSYRLPTGYARIYEWVHGLLEPSVSVNQKRIWNSPGYFEGMDSPEDFSSALNAYLSNATVSGTDTYGNSYVDIPLKVGSKNNGTIIINDLKITYLCNFSVPDFSTPLNEYIQANKAQKDANGNLTIPFTLKSRTPGKVRMCELNILVDDPPLQFKSIPDLVLDEDTINPALIDLWDYFRDDFDGNSRLKFDVFSATDNDIVKVRISNGHFLSVDAFNGPQNDNWTGTLEVVVTAEDSWNSSTMSNAFNVTVQNTPDPPMIVSRPPLEAFPGQEYVYQVRAMDGDGDRLFFGLGPSPPNMTIDSASGRLSWMPHVVAGEHAVSVSVTDGIFTSFQNYFVNVSNAPPGITNTTVLAALVGVPYEFTIPAEDANGDKLNFSMVRPVEGMGIDSATGRLAWIPNATGIFAVSVRISDGTASIIYDFNITVTQGNRVPKFTSVPVTTANVDSLHIYNMTGIDADNDTLAYSLVSGPSGMLLDGSSGKLTWMPSIVGNFTVNLTVADGKGGVARQEFVIKVSGAVRPEVSITSPIAGNWKGIVDILGTVRKGTREISLVQLRVDSGGWKDAKGTSNWNWSLDTLSLRDGKHTIQARAYDGKEYSDTFSRDFNVDNEPSISISPVMGGLAIVPIVIVVVVLLLIARRRKR